MMNGNAGRGPSPQDELAATRAEVREILLPEDEHEPHRVFPRSATMRTLTHGRTASVLALIGVAILATRPGIAGRLARAAPLINLLRQKRWTGVVPSVALIAFLGWEASGATRGVIRFWTQFGQWLTHFGTG